MRRRDRMTRFMQLLYKNKQKECYKRKKEKWDNKWSTSKARPT
jgi:hypothetical protein